MSLLDKFNNTDRTVLNIILVGCGNVGITLVEHLSDEGHYITIIDKDAEIVKTVSNTYDVMGVVGNGSSYNTLMEAGIENADLIIAVTDSDELNLLCCTIAKKVGHCAAIARVRTPDYADELPYLRSRLDISMIINPELEAARAISRLLRLPGAISINTFLKGNVEMVTFKIAENSPLHGKTLQQLQDPYLVGILLCGVERGDELTIPNGAFRLEAGDTVSFIATARNAQKFFKRIGVATKAVSSTLIVGGGKISEYLAKMLLDAGISVTIIEKKHDRCLHLAETLSDATVLHGDGADTQTLSEAGITDIGSFIPLTNSDEENILLTLYAKKNTGAKVITKVDRMNFHDVLTDLDMDSVVYPQYMTTEAIIAYARAKQDSIGSNIETLYHFFDERAEAIEFRVNECSFAGIPLMKLPLKKDLLIACINRSGKVIIPSGQDCILEGDTVIIVTKHTGFDEIEDIFTERHI